MPLREDGQVARSHTAPLQNLSGWRHWKTARYRALTSAVLEESGRLRALSDAELQQNAALLRGRTAAGANLSGLLVPAFAVVREASRRVLGMEHYPVQILAGIGLHYGHVVQMATGEGKTLAAVMPAYLNALSQRGVHVVTVNDYLARRDAEEMGRVYRFLGLSVGMVTHETPPAERRAAYRADLTYATNKDLGFDFLRDQEEKRSEPWFAFGRPVADLAGRRLQRPDWHYAIIDEADSILIDDARTPLILAAAPGVDEDATYTFGLADQAAQRLREGVDFSFDRKAGKIEWLAAGVGKVTSLLGAQRRRSGRRVDWHECCLRALKAHHQFRRDVEYVVEEDEIVIVDENTGRKMPGRQWEEGLHQAVACKEGLTVKGPTQTLARTTYQLYFNRYEKLAGMTGTALTDAHELAAVFGIGTLAVPTNRPCRRETLPDRIFASEDAKWAAVVERVKELVAAGRPVLIGTRSIEKSEHLSQLLSDAQIEHVVLNARHEEEEAAIVSHAGLGGRVTVATNMAGRGTDVKLADGVAEAGGLCVLGTERHESRRVDLQLLGRCARQGDPGTAQFFVSVEDPLLRKRRPKQSAKLAARYFGRSDPIPGSAVRRFFRRVQLGIERLHRRQRLQLLRHERELAKANRHLGIE